MPPGRRRQGMVLALLVPLAALAEMISIGAIVPMLALLSNAREARDLPWFADWLATTADRLDASALQLAVALFAVAAVMAAAIRLLLARSTQIFAYGLSHELKLEIQRRVLFQPYLFHAAHHSSRAIASLDKVEQFVFSLLVPLVQGIGAATIGLFIIAALMIVDPASTLLALLSVSAIYGLVLLATRKRMGEYDATIGEAYDKRIKTIQESLGGIRDIILDHLQLPYLDAFRTVDGRLMRARRDSMLLTIAPRFIIEAIGLVVFALLALVLSARPGGLTAALPVIGALALGAQRLLPLIQQLYRGWASMATSRSIIDQLLVLLRLPVETGDDGPPLDFRDSIRLENVDFHYEARSPGTLSNVNLAIRKGARVALVGRTGSGKTTLTDLVMGLIEPSTGRILIDGVELNRATARAWQRNIAHVPQAIFLADATIARNIAFTSPDGTIDMERARRAAAIAQLDEFVASLPDGYETIVGERGVRLSGGQRQRLGLARAIYKQAPVLILDEATSALDDATEQAVLRALDELDAAGCTILIVAHRTSTIASCDEVVRLDEGRIVDMQDRRPAGAKA